MKIRVIAFFFLAGCTANPDQLPPAGGTSGSIFVIMNQSQWKGQIGKTLDSLFSAEMEGLPRKESIFKFRWIDPAKLNYVLKQSRNLIFVISLNKGGQADGRMKTLFSGESLKQIQSDTQRFVHTASNVYAKGQEIMYIIGRDDASLLADIKQNGQKLVDYFSRTERARLSRSLFKSGTQKGAMEIVRKEYQGSINIPFGYQYVMHNQEFWWVRQINSRDDKDVFIARKKYNAPADFEKPNLIRFRNDICRKYLFEDPEKADTYLLTETDISHKPIILREINYNNHYAVEVKGLWRTNNLTMGGPFMALAFVDEKQGMLYYAEGFTYSPSKDQREIMRELETIIYSFQTSDMLEVQSKSELNR